MSLYTYSVKANRLHCAFRIDEFLCQTVKDIFIGFELVNNSKQYYIHQKEKKCAIPDKVQLFEGLKARIECFKSYVAYLKTV